MATPTLRLMQTGTFECTGLDQEVTLGTALLDTTKAFLLWTAYSNNTDGSARNFVGSGRIYSTTKLRFYLNRSDSSSLYINWTVYEFTQGVRVQHFYQSSHLSGAITIDEIDQTKAWITASYCSGSTISSGRTWNNDTACFYFDSNTSVNFSETGTIWNRTCLQIIQWDTATVQHFSQSSDRTDITITAVNLSHALVFGSTKITNYTYGDAVLSRFLYSTTILRDWIGSYSNVREELFVVELPEFTVVQGICYTNDNWTNPITQSISAVDLSKSAIIHNTPFFGWTSEINQGQKAEGQYSACRIKFNSTTQIEFQRGQSSPVTYGTRFYWQLLSFSGSVASSSWLQKGYWWEQSTDSAGVI